MAFLAKSLVLSICCVHSPYCTLRTMVKNAIKWARAHGFVRTNPIHGAEEFRVTTFESFNHSDTNRSTMRASQEVVLEDCIVVHSYVFCFACSWFQDAGGLLHGDEMELQPPGWAGLNCWLLVLAVTRW